jgi:hypothetical protein
MDLYTQPIKNKHTPINHRITPLCEEDFPRLRDWLISHSCPLFVVRENTNKHGVTVRPHMHSYIEFNLTKSTYGQQFGLDKKRAKFPEYKGNGVHSIQVCKHYDCSENLISQYRDENFQYLCKGWRGPDGVLRPPLVLFNNTLTEEKIKEYQLKYWEVYDERILQHSKAKPIEECVTAPRKHKPTWIEETIEHIRKVFQDRGEQVHLRDPIHKQIIYVEMMRRLGKASKNFDEIMFMKMMNNVENALRPDHKEALFYDQLKAKYPFEFMAHMDYARFVPESPEISMRGIRELSRNKTPKST